MAKNVVRDGANEVGVPVPSGTVSGNIVVIGDLPGVALCDRGAWTAGEATVKFNGSVSVKIVSTAVAVGDIIYITSGGSITKTATSNTRIGVALSSCSSTASPGADIEVKLAK